MNRIMARLLAIAVSVWGCSDQPTNSHSNLASSGMVGVWQDKVAITDRYRAYLVLRPDGTFLSRQVATFAPDNRAFYMDNVGKFSLSADGKTVNYFDMGRPEDVDCSAFTNPKGVEVKSGLAFVDKELRLDFTSVMTRKFGTSFPAIQYYTPIAELPPLPQGAEPRCHPIVTI